MPKNTLNVVVTCTKQKKLAAPKSLCVSALKKGSVADRFADWKQRLTESTVEKCAVADLYSGDHWATVRAFASKRFHLKVWVASAGYGLVAMDDKIAPYAATFSKENKDSVFAKVPKVEYLDAGERWWKQLTSWRFTSHSRSLKGLARSRPSEPMLVVASDNYLKAIGEDLSAAANQLEDRNLLSILSAGCKSLNGLSENLLPCDARLQHVVSGARRSLNTRVAAHLISGASSLPTKPKLEQRLAKLMKDLPEIPKFDRTPATDEEVSEFIRVELIKEPKMAHTPLLRKFRDSGRACEQSRFRNLFKDVKAEIS